MGNPSATKRNAFGQVRHANEMDEPARTIGHADRHEPPLTSPTRHRGNESGVRQRRADQFDNVGGEDPESAARRLDRADPSPLWIDSTGILVAVVSKGTRGRTMRLQIIHEVALDARIFVAGFDDKIGAIEADPFGGLANVE